MKCDRCGDRAMDLTTVALCKEVFEFGLSKWEYASDDGQIETLEHSLCEKCLSEALEMLLSWVDSGPTKREK